jgi:hypothetical protein
MPEPPGDEVPDEAPMSAASTTSCVTMAGIREARGDGLRDGGAGDGADEVERPAMRTAVRMGSTPVETTVAIAFAASWKPLM